jgi:sugar O-acyltransferase (sialic acid O-acetyltransferase NeuD family)
MNDLVIVGAGGFAAEMVYLAEAILQQSGENPPFAIKGIISQDGSKSRLLGSPILGNDAWAWNNLSPHTRFVVAIGDPEIRDQVSQKYAARGWQAISLIHPSVTIHSSNQIGRGCMICAGVQITTQVKLGQHVLLNLNCTVGHDCVVGDCVTLSPSANLSGGVKLADKVYIGSGATVLPGVQIGEKAILGAGAVATRDLAPHTTYVGIPARPLPWHDRDEQNPPG